MKDFRLIDFGTWQFESKDGSLYRVTDIFGDLLVEEVQGGILISNDKAEKIKRKIENL